MSVTVSLIIWQLLAGIYQDVLGKWLDVLILKVIQLLRLVSSFQGQRKLEAMPVIVAKSIYHLQHYLAQQ
jgi:hypothetical protein